MMRIGQCDDVLAFVVGELFILGSVHFLFDWSLVAHSDGDLVFHALIVSSLGGLGLGDIGQHFPDTNEKYRDCDSQVQHLHAHKKMPTNISV